MGHHASNSLRLLLRLWHRVGSCCRKMTFWYIHGTAWVVFRLPQTVVALIQSYYTLLQGCRKDLLQGCLPQGCCKAAAGLLQGCWQAAAGLPPGYDPKHNHFLGYLGLNGLRSQVAYDPNHNQFLDTLASTDFEGNLLTTPSIIIFWIP